jgi:hypothetical protein
MKTCKGCYKYDVCDYFNKGLDVPCYEYHWEGVIRTWGEVTVNEDGTVNMPLLAGEGRYSVGEGRYLVARHTQAHIKHSL